MVSVPSGHSSREGYPGASQSWAIIHYYGVDRVRQICDSKFSGYYTLEIRDMKGFIVDCEMQLIIEKVICALETIGG